jgi:hypothetical protein
MNIQDIIPDREIIKMKNDEFAGIEYETWHVQLPLYGDRIETLLENGFLVSVIYQNCVTVSKALNPSPEKLHENKMFWNELKSALNISTKNKKGD